MFAAQILNAAEGRNIQTLYDIVTTGDIWEFLRLEGTAATVDSDLYYQTDVKKIVGIALSMLQCVPIGGTAGRGAS